MSFHTYTAEELQNELDEEIFKLNNVCEATDNTVETINRAQDRLISLGDSEELIRWRISEIKKELDK